MATTDAIDSLGQTILSLVQSKLPPLVLPGDVILATPEKFKSFAPVNASVTIFLYNVGINGEMRNTLRPSLVNGARQRPPLPLELRFLVTPWTSDTRGAYKIIGTLAQLFYDHAVLGFGELLGDDIWAPDDTVEIVMESLSVEEHYDIWEPSDIPYRLSLAYLARVIGIDSTVSTVAPPVAVATFSRGSP